MGGDSDKIAYPSLPNVGDFEAPQVSYGQQQQQYQQATYAGQQQYQQLGKVYPQPSEQSKLLQT